MFRLPTAEEELFRAEMRRLGERELAPHYQPDDRSGEMNPAIRGHLARTGVLGLRIPQEYGGQGASAVIVGIAAEELSRANINAAYLLLSTTLVSDVLLAHGSPEQKACYLPAIADGSVLPTLALTEPSHGSDAANLTLRAERRGDDWVLHGEKTSISLAAQSDTAMIFARTGQSGARGISAFYVDLDAEGIDVVRLDDIGDRAAGRGSIFFDGARIAPERMIGAEGHGFISVMQGFDYSRAIIGLMTVGAASQALEDAVEYAKQRNTFGQPISTRQGVAFPLVESLARVRSARHLCYEALELKDQDRRHIAEASMAKWWAPKVAVEAIHQALLTFGHAAWSGDNPQGQRLRDAMGFEIADGTAQIAKLVVAREVFGRQFAP